MDNLFLNLLTEQGAAVGLCLFFCFCLTGALIWVVKKWQADYKALLAQHEEERERIYAEHKQERGEAWRAHNLLLERTLEGNNRLSHLIETVLRSKL